MREAGGNLASFILHEGNMVVYEVLMRSNLL